VAKSLGRVIRDLRQEAGLTRAELARAANLDPAALTHIEKEDRTELRFTTVCQLSAALGISTDEFAVRAGLLKAKGVVRGRPSGKGAALLAGLNALESLLARAALQLGQLKKRLSSEP
jgi:transcriptional regulator with XRE-family HTH domain